VHARCVYILMLLIFDKSGAANWMLACCGRSWLVTWVCDSASSVKSFVHAPSDHLPSVWAYSISEYCCSRYSIYQYRNNRNWKRQHNNVKT
jgi:hypothetical protein